MGTETEKHTESENDTTQKDQKTPDVKEFAPITSQEEFDAKIAGRLRRLDKSVRDEVREELRAELEEEAKKARAKEENDFQSLLTAAEKDLQKANERIKELEGEIAERDLTTLKAQVAKDNGLPDSAIEFLVGDDKASLTAAAKKLASMVAKEESADIDLGESTGTTRRTSTTSKDDKYSDPKIWGLPTS